MVVVGPAQTILLKNDGMFRRWHLVPDNCVKTILTTECDPVKHTACTDKLTVPSAQIWLT